MTKRTREWVFSGWTWRLAPGRGRVVLTFDDGPDPQSTPALLCALSDSSIPAHHFLIGERCTANPSLACDIIAAGHELGNHAFSHRRMWLRSSRFQSASIHRAHEAIAAATQGYSCSWYRPPYGSFNFQTGAALRRTGYTGALWSALPRDWEHFSAAGLLRSLVAGLHDGAIILLHDTPRSMPQIIAALPAFAGEVERRGWKFVTLPSTPPPNGSI